MIIDVITCMCSSTYTCSVLVDLNHRNFISTGKCDIEALEADIFNEDLNRLVLYASDLFRRDVIRADRCLDVSVACSSHTIFL